MLKGTEGSVYSQLPSIPRNNITHPEPENVSCYNNPLKITLLILTHKQVCKPSNDDHNKGSNFSKHEYILYSCCKFHIIRIHKS